MTVSSAPNGKSPGLRILSCGFCVAALCFVKKTFFCARLVNAVCVLSPERPGRITDEVRAKNRSEEHEELQGPLGTLKMETLPSPHTLPGFTHDKRHIATCRWKISPLSIEKSICNATWELLRDLFSDSSVVLMFFPHSFLCNQQLHKGDAQELLSKSLIIPSNFSNQWH